MSGVVSLANKSFKTKTKVQLFKHQDQVALVVKNLPANARDVGSIPGLGRSTGVVTHSSILAWRIPWTEKPGGLQSMGPQKS